MKISNKIEKLIKKRETLANKLYLVDIELADFIDDNAIEVENYDYRMGVEMLVNPENSAERIRKAILEK